MSDTGATEEFGNIVERLTESPLVKKKASAIGGLMFMLLVTWVLLLPALVWAVYGWAF